jgi:peroxiredoxin
VTATDQTIAEQSAALRAGFALKAPARIVDAFAAEQANLDAAGLPQGIAEPGTPMPDAKLLDVHGAATTLAEARWGQAAVVVFYRGDWCPYCNLTLRTYQQHLVPALAARDLSLIAISPQKPDGSLTMQEANKLTFTVLSDPGNQIAGQLGSLSTPPDAVREAQAGLGVDVAAGNADGTHTLPMPTVVLIDADGLIRWIDVHPNYTTRTEVPEILAAVESQLGR